MDFKQFIGKLRQAIKDYPSKTARKKIADKTLDQIKDRTIEGFGVNQDGDQKTRLKPIAESTVNIRKSLKARGKLGPKAVAERSQVYRSGKMLDSTKPRFQKKGFTISPQGSTEKKKAESLDSRGFKWLNLSDSELKEMVEEFDLVLEKELQNKLK